MPRTFIDGREVKKMTVGGLPVKKAYLDGRLVFEASRGTKLYMTVGREYVAADNQWMYGYVGDSDWWWDIPGRLEPNDLFGLGGFLSFYTTIKNATNNDFMLAFATTDAALSFSGITIDGDYWPVTAMNLTWNYWAGGYIATWPSGKQYPFGTTVGRVIEIIVHPR